MKAELVSVGPLCQLESVRVPNGSLRRTDKVSQKLLPTGPHWTEMSTSHVASELPLRSQSPCIQAGLSRTEEVM